MTAAADGTDAVAGWITELTSAVRLYGQGKAGADDVIALATHIWATEGEASERQGVFVVRQLLVVAGQATVDEEQDVFDGARRLIAECPEADRSANSADQILTAFANVGQSAVAVRAVKDSYPRRFP